MKKIKQDTFLLTLGGIAYGIIELLWRQRTHWSMILTGGVCFLTLFKIFNKATHLTLPRKCLIGSTVITAVELFVGCFVNLHLNLAVWDYSNLPLNLWGQVSLLYSVLWGFLTIPISFICNKVKKVLPAI